MSIEVVTTTQLRKLFLEHVDNHDFFTHLDVDETRKLNGDEINFLIQYTMFVKQDDDWFLLFIQPNNVTPHDEGIHNIINIVPVSDDDGGGNTCVVIQAVKNSSWYTELDCNLCYRSNSTSNRVYTIDLFPDVKSKHYQGEIWTRGSFNGWNVFSS